MMYTELARFPLRVNRIFSMIKYWYKLLNTDNCILQCCYSQMYTNVELIQQINWAYGVKTELCKLGYGDVWVNQEMDKNLLPVIWQGLYNQALQGIVEQVYSSSKCNIYKYFIDSIHLQYYLRKPIPKLYQKYFSKYRLTSHKLSIETGRFCNTGKRIGCVHIVKRILRMNIILC
jgi:hypothetical protein